MSSSFNPVQRSSKFEVYNSKNDVNGERSKNSSASSAPAYMKSAKSNIQSGEQRETSNSNKGVLKSISNFLSRVFTEPKNFKIVKAYKSLISYIKSFVKKDKNDLQPTNIINTSSIQSDTTAYISFTQNSHFDARALTDEVTDSLKNAEPNKFININDGNLPYETIHKDNRQQIGGKGMHLEMIQKLELPVPSFTCISIDTTTDIFNTQIPKDQLQQLIEYNLAFNSLSSLLDTKNTSFVSLFEIIKQISTVNNKENQAGCISELKALMNMPQFANLYDSSQAYKAIDKIHTDFSARLTDSNQKIIIRSSGQKEDDYGNSQAGSYDSIKMYSNESIMPVIMQVLASAIKEDTITLDHFVPMSLVVQEYIDCQYGGVAFSYSSLTNNTMQVETAFGSSSAAVSGCEESSGNISKIALERDESGKLQSISFMETDESQPSESQMKDLFSYIMALENKLQCPVDVEFCIDKYNTLWLLQVRPITHLSGAMTFNLKSNSAGPLTQGSLCSEGLATGYLRFINEASKVDSIPDNDIVIAEQGHAYMLEDSFLDRIGGLILRQGGANTHLAIQCRQKNIPFMVITDEAYGLVDDKTLVTLCCGNIQGQSSGYLFVGEQENCVEASGTTSHLTPDSFKLHTCTKKQIFTNPGEWFKWLNNQNYHLLNYLEQDSIISKLLSSIGQTEWCMSSNRIPMFNSLKHEIANFTQDMKSLGEVYQNQFDENDDKHKEAQDILNHIERFEKEISLLLNNIKTGFIEGSTSLNDMNQTCRELNKLLIELTKPENSTSCKSMHDAIYILHKLFINNTKNIALIKNNKSEYTDMSVSKYISVRESAYMDNHALEETEIILSEINKTESKDFHKINDFSPESPLPLEFLHALCKIDCSSVTHNFKDLIISNLALGQHQCTIEMALNAENNKGIALKVQFNDTIGGNKHSDGKLKRMLFVAQTLQRNLGDNTSLKFKLVDDIMFLDLETTNMKNIEQLIKEFNGICTTMELLKNIDMDIDKKMLPNIPLNLTYNDISTITNEKSIDTENEMREFLLLLCIKKSYNKKTTVEEMRHVFNKDSELVNYGLALIKSAKNKEPIPEIPEHYDTKLKSRLQKYRFLLYPIKSLEENMVSEDILADPQNLIMAMQNANCIQQIKEFGNEDTLKQIGENFDFVVQCMLSKSDITPYINLSPEQMKTAIKKSIKYVSHDLNTSYLSEKIASILKLDKYQSLTQDHEFIIFLLKNMKNFLKYTSDEVKDNYEMVMAAVSSSGSCLKWASKQLQNNKKIVMAAVSNHGSALEYASDNLQNDKEIVIEALDKKCNFKLISSRFRDDAEVVTAAVSLEKYNLDLASNRLKDNEQVVMTAVSENGASLEWASKHLQDNERVVLSAVSNDGFSLRYASDRLKNDYDTIMAAVSSNGFSLEYASNRLKNDYDIVMTAVSNNGCSLNNTRKKLKDDYDIVMAAVSNDGRSLKYASKRLQDDSDIVMNAISKDEIAFKYASKRLKNNEKIAVSALKKNPTIEIFKQVSKELQSDANFLSSLKENVSLLANLKKLFKQNRSDYYKYFSNNQHLEALLNS